MAGPIPKHWTPPLLSVLRIVTGLLFIPHGTQKLFGAPALDARTPVGLATLQGVAGILELVGGLLILLGLGTRPIAFLLSGEMAVAYFYRHHPQAFWPILNRGELAALYCFIFLFLAAAGGGPWSVDGWMKRGHHTGMDQALDNALDDDEPERRETPAAR